MTARLRTLAAAAGAVVALAGLATVPAAASTGSYSSPGSDGQSFSSQPTISGIVVLDQEIETFTLQVVPARDDRPGASVTASCASPPSGFSCESPRKMSFSWRPTFPYNGTYTVRGRAQGRPPDGVEAESFSLEARSFKLNVPPAAPRSVSAVANAERQVTITWRQNSEPDIIGYRLYRMAPGASRADVTDVAAGEAATMEYTDSSAVGGPGGAYKYWVTAVRSSADPSGSVSSDPSNVATVEMAGPPPTTKPPGSGGGTTGGGAGSGGGTGGGATTGGAPGGETPRGGSTGGRGVPSGSLSSNAAGSGPSSYRGIDLSGFRALAAGAEIPGAVGPPDPGFDPNLPYAPGQGPTEDGQPPQALPGTSRVITEVTSNKKTLMTFLAGAMLLFILSMHMRWLLRRAAPAS